VPVHALIRRLINLIAAAAVFLARVVHVRQEYALVIYPTVAVAHHQT